MGSIGDLWFALRAKDDKLADDIAKAGAAGGAKGGEVAGKAFGDRFRAGIADMRLDVAKGFKQGLGLGAGLGAANLVANAVGDIKSAFADSLDAAKAFEGQLRTINTVARFSDRQLSSVGDSIQELARETGKSTDELTSGFYDLVSAGIPADKAMGVLKDSAILATGALGTTEQTVDLLTSVLNAYGMEATQSTRLTDVFAQAVMDGKVSAAELGETIAQIAPIASQAGVSIEEIGAGYAVMTAKGTPAAQAATQMRSAIVALLSPNAELNKIQKATGINFAELMKAKGVAAALQALSTAVGGNEQAMIDALGRVEAYQFALTTTGINADEFAEAQRRMADAAARGGVALGQYEERSKSAEVQDQKLAAQIQILQQDFGELLLPIGTGLVAASIAAIEAIRNLGDAFHDLERFMSPHLAELEDQIKGYREYAESIGADADAIEAYVLQERELKAAREESAQAALDQADISEDLARQYKDLVGHFEDLLDVWGDGQVTQEEIDQTTQMATDAMREQGYAIDEATGAWQRFARGADDATAAADDVRSTVDAIIEQQGELARGRNLAALLRAQLAEIGSAAEQSADAIGAAFGANARSWYSYGDDAIAAYQAGVIDGGAKLRSYLGVLLPGAWSAGVAAATDVASDGGSRMVTATREALAAFPGVVEAAFEQAGKKSKVVLHTELQAAKQQARLDGAEIVWAMKHPMSQAELGEFYAKKIRNWESKRRKAIREGNTAALAIIDAHLEEWRQKAAALNATVWRYNLEIVATSTVLGATGGVKPKPTHTIGDGGAPGKPKGYAKGGIIPAGGLGIVGDAGRPELAQALPGGGVRVTPFDGMGGLRSVLASVGRPGDLLGGLTSMSSMAAAGTFIVPEATTLQGETHHVLSMDAATIAALRAAGFDEERVGAIAGRVVADTLGGARRTSGVVYSGARG